MERAVNWSALNAPAKTWQDVAVSADGQLVLAASSSSGGVYLSSNGGDTWSLIGTATASGIRVAVSGDGLYMAIAEAGTGNLYKSSNSGSSWTLHPSSFGTDTRDLEISSTGQYWVISTYNGYFRVSSDYGATWYIRAGASTGLRTGGAVSANGQIIVHTQDNNSYLSIDNGSNFNTIYRDGFANGMPSYGGGVSMSDSGQYITIAPRDGSTYNLYRSIDSGTSFAAVDSVRSWNSVSMDATGQYQVACVLTGNVIYFSQDYGATWAPITITGATTINYATISKTDGLSIFAIGRSVASSVIYRSTLGVAEITDTQVIASDSDSFEMVRPWTVLHTDSYTVPTTAQTLSISPDNRTITETNVWGDISFSRVRNYRLGRNWFASPTPPPIASIRYSACSLTGSIQIVSGTSGYIYKSTNSGATWAQLANAGSRSWNGLAISHNGSYMTAVVNGGYIYASSDGGGSWNTISSPGSKPWVAVSMSGDGRYQSACNSNTSNTIYCSDNWGGTWTSRSGLYATNILVCETGAVQFALPPTGSLGLNRSTNNGVTWTNISVTGFRASHIACNTDGTKVAVIAGPTSPADHNGRFFSSTTSGTSWGATSELFYYYAGYSNRKHRGLALSRDASRMVSIYVNNDGTTCSVVSSYSFGDTWELTDTLPFVPQGRFAYSADLDYLMIDDGV